MRFFVPETVQTSAVDCGPAALKSILDGFALPASYGRLREACQTGLDGTSIDTIEEVARELGLDAEQVMVPVEHLDLDDTLLPAVVVITLPNGFAHFVVVWRKVGPFFQVMDPAEGRIWVRRREFLASVYRHRQTVNAADWREWAAGEGMRSVETMLAQCALPARDGADVERLHAATRMTWTLVRTGAIAKGSEAKRFLDDLLTRDDAQIPDSFRDVEPAGSGDELLLKGAVLLRIRGTASATTTPTRPDLREALKQGEIQPARRLLTFLDPSVRRMLPLLAVAIALLGTTTVIEGLVFRSLFDLVDSVGLSQHRLIGLGVLLLFALSYVLIEYDVSRRFVAVGREMEGRLAAAFLSRIATLRNEYFGSRLVSDMAERANAIHEIRNVPMTGVRMIRAVVSLLATSIALVYLAPGTLMAVLIGIAVMLLFVFAFQSLFYERDIRARTHAGGLTRFYLDALTGLTTLHAHCAERSVRREHESLLTEWYRTMRGQITASVSLDTLLAFCGVATTAVMLVQQLRTGGDPGGILLIAYWGLNLPMAAAELANTIQVWGIQRSIAMRLIEPLDAPEEERGQGGYLRSTITFEHATFTIAGHDVLTDVQLAIDAGEHIAIVGRSGAGKSTLVASLLGLIAPREGAVLVDGAPLDADSLRAQTAWVDPAVQLWNAPLEANIVYAARGSAIEQLPLVLREAELYEVLERVADLQRPIGEAGGLLSGGEGQRVRVARALMQRDARLVILDEAFRGVDRETRRELLRRCRALWRNATMLCVTHDIDEAMLFDRVLVLEDGRIVHDAAPETLLHLRDAAARVRDEVWGSDVWRRLNVAESKVREDARAEVVR
ncbi:MAG TPA: ATP-binding cassette domain-containing protein [Thermoanaerobaculia bacterium]|jgi:ATP-binding cassette subfamily B protein